MRRSLCAGVLLAAGWLAPRTALAQEGPPVEVGGLLRVGFRAEPESSQESDGFAVFDARLKVRGKIGIVFDYYFETHYDQVDDAFELFDARATLPLIPEFELTFGMFRPPFGYEALQERGELTYLERSQASTAIAPGRQIGMQGGGEALDGRLTYGGGLFNGNGRTVENDGDNYMFTGRVQFNSIGTIAFYDDLVVQVGASLGYSSDTAAELGLGSVTGDPAAVPELTTAFAGKRFFWGADFQATYRSWALTGEYLRADYELDAAIGGGGPIDTEAFGGYVELGYRAYGALEAVVRYDGFSPTLGDNRDFMVFGFNVYPGYYAKFGLQYAVGINDSPDAATLADGQFLFVAQVDF